MISETVHLNNCNNNETCNSVLIFPYVSWAVVNELKGMRGLSNKRVREFLKDEGEEDDIL